MIGLDPRARLRLQRGAEHVHRLGPRAMAELLAELAHQTGSIAATLDVLDDYQRRLTPAMIAVVGASSFPPWLRAVA